MNELCTIRRRERFRDKTNNITLVFVYKSINLLDLTMLSGNNSNTEH